MIAKTRGIALGKIKFRETSIIARVFTEKFGLQSYLVNGVRTSKGKFRIGLFQPLTLLDLVVYHKESVGIQRLSEAKCLYPYSTIEGNVHKSAIVIFLTEILEKTLRECSNPEDIFVFLNRSLIRFDHQGENNNLFHLKFLIDYSGLLGFKPNSIQDFENHLPIQSSLTDDTRALLRHLIEGPEQKKPVSTNTTRRNSLNLILMYYKSHIDSLKEIKSINVLKEILE